MNTCTTLITSTLLAAGLISGAAQAALIDRGGGLIYDTDLNVTWLADANYAKTSGYDADGAMNWIQATTWAANLSYFDSVRNVTYDDWRLPTSADTGAAGFHCTYSGTDCGFNVDPASSELAHLFFVGLGNTSAYTTDGVYKGGATGVNWGLVNKGSFTNFQQSYWSGGGGYVQAFSELAFSTYFGWQTFEDRLTTYRSALAVRPGDVAAVPETQTYALMLAGLGLIGWRARRRG